MTDCVKFFDNMLISNRKFVNDALRHEGNENRRLALSLVAPAMV